jgi:hypothetical protein
LSLTAGRGVLAAPGIDEAMLAESLVSPIDADTVARLFEDRATGA